MINILVDEACAYDMLSILTIKYREKKLDSQACDNFCLLNNAIWNQIPYHDKVRSSVQYKELFSVNEQLFALIDEYKIRGETLGDAGKIDNLNYRRYLAKNALQSAFFSSPISEQKLGYK